MARAAEQGTSQARRGNWSLSRPQDQIIVVGEDWQTTAAGGGGAVRDENDCYVLVLEG
jgi:hypothetical protein